MAATLKSRQVDDVIVIDFEGRIVLGGGSSTLRAAARDLVVNGQTKILLNLAEVSYIIDSSGLGELVAAFTAVSNNGGQLKMPRNSGDRSAAARYRYLE